MTNIIPFSFKDNPVRVVSYDGNPWFVAKDVAELLGYSNPRKAVRDHCQHTKAMGRGNDSFPLDPQTKIIPEPDVYRLVMRSKLPQAQKFESWVLEEVLPTIRKHGVYSNLDLDNASRSDKRVALLRMRFGRRDPSAPFALARRLYHAAAVRVTGATCTSHTAHRLSHDSTPA